MGEIDEKVKIILDIEPPNVYKIETEDNVGWLVLGKVKTPWKCAKICNAFSPFNYPVR